MSVRAETVKNTKITKQTVLIYTGLFLLMLAVIYSVAFISDSSFIWEGDGLSQHFQLYIDYVRKLKNFLGGGGFSLWDWSIGPGADVVTSYGYYVIGDPFVYLGVLFPAALREFSYHFLIFVRMWFVGGSFLLFARKLNFSHYSGLLGALMYAFSHYVIYNVVRHPFFILPMIWYPLMCLGVEKILRKESGTLFALAVALSAVSNFYFFYKLTLLILLYGVVRFGSPYGFRNSTKEMLQLFLKCLIYYLIGVLISAVIFLPMVWGFLTGSRSPSGPPFNLLFYTLEYYFLLFHNAFIPGTYMWTVGGLSIFLIFALVFLYRRKKLGSYVKISLAVLGLLLLFPFFGAMMNGFSSPYNRFTFALPFYGALASGYLLDNRASLEKKDFQISKYILIAFTVLHVITAFVMNQLLLFIFPAAVGWVMWFVLRHEQQKPLSAVKVSRVLIGLIALNMAGNAFNFYYPHGKDALAESMDLGASEENYQNILGGAEEVLPEDDVYRVGVSSKDNQVRNQFVYHNIMGLNSYLSITNGALSDFAQEMELGTFQVIQPLRNGLDDRRVLNHLFNIEYILTEEENESYLPESYETMYRTEEEPSFIAARTDKMYPLIYAEQTWMPYAEFTELNPVEKEAFLAEGTVLESGGEMDLDRFSGELPVQTVPYTVTGADPGIREVESGRYEVSEENAQVQLAVENPEALTGHDIYIRLQGLEHDLLEERPFIRQNTGYRTRVFYEDREKSILQSDEFSFSSYFYRENMLFNMGHTEEGTEELTLQFDDTGIYRIEEIEIYALPASEEADRETAAERWENALENVSFEDERIAGTIQQDTDSMLATTIPYTSGWKAFVNGEPVETVRSNIGFIGLPLESGNSEVVLTYETPFLKAGAVISVIGIVLLGGAEYFFRKRK